MIETHSSNPPQLNPGHDFDLRRQIDALAQGECTEDEFLRDTLGIGDSDADSAWNLLSIIDQHYRRGELPSMLFHSIKSRITRHAVAGKKIGIVLKDKPQRGLPSDQVGRILQHR